MTEVAQEWLSNAPQVGSLGSGTWELEIDEEADAVGRALWGLTSVPRIETGVTSWSEYRERSLISSDVVSNVLVPSDRLQQVSEATSPLAALLDDGDGTDRADILLGSLRFRSIYPHKERVASRIEALVEFREEEPDDAPLSVDSLKSLIGFLQENPQLLYPDLFLTPAGNIRAEWHVSWEMHFAVEFLGSNKSQFVLFAPDPKLGGETMRISGDISTEALPELAGNYGALDWMEER